jgi:hypothetical protein
MSVKYMGKLKYLMILPLLFVSVFAPISVSALEYGGIGGKPANPNPNNPRTKSIFIFTLAANQVSEDELLVINNTAVEKTLLIYATDSQRGSDGSFACEQYSDTKDNVGSWIELDKEEVILQAGKNEKVKFKITAPDAVDVGESNGCIMIQEKLPPTSEEASGVSLSFRTGLRVVVTVPGEQIRELAIENFDVWQENGMIKAKIDIKNTGNVSIDTLVRITTKSALGFEHNKIENEYPILRDEIATYNFEIPSPAFGGPYNISAELEYDKSAEAEIGIPSGEPNLVLQGETFSIFVTPTIGALVVELLILAAIVAIIYFIFKKYKLSRQIRNSWVIYKPLPGETLNSIAKKFNIDWNVLAKANSIKPPYELASGATIKVPSSN